MFLFLMNWRGSRPYREFIKTLRKQSSECGNVELIEEIGLKEKK